LKYCKMAEAKLMKSREYNPGMLSTDYSLYNTTGGASNAGARNSNNFKSTVFS